MLLVVRNRDWIWPEGGLEFPSLEHGLVDANGDCVFHDGLDLVGTGVL